MTKVLVVEDDKFLAGAYSAKMTKEGFEFRLATDGEEAIAVLKEFIPDVILLDLIMPRKDGFATLAEIKADERLKNIPVIVTTNLGQKEDQDRVMGLGAAGFVTKSDMSLEDIVNKIKQTAGVA